MDSIARWWCRVQACLWPQLERCLEAPLTEKHKELAAVLEVVRIEEQVPSEWQWLGRPRCDRRALARAFVAKALYNLPTTELLIEWLRTDANLCRICGWERADQVPSAATFSRAFEEFARTGLADRVHEAAVRKHLGSVLVGHVSRDATEIEAREEPVKRERSEPSSRLERQRAQTAPAAIAELPTVCGIGVKRNAQGHKSYWIGYKLHLDACDAGLPLTALTTSPWLHDSQAAIPLAKRTADRVTALCEVMDSSYAAELIREQCRELGHVPIIDPHPMQRKKAPLDPASARRYDERTTVERVYSRLKDHFGARFVRVRGPAKVHAHLMFGVRALFGAQCPASTSFSANDN